MHFEKERTKKIMDVLEAMIVSHTRPIAPITYSFGKEKTGDWLPFEQNARWGGFDKHYWFQADVTIPDEFGGERVDICLTTGREGEWDAKNPQFILFVDGRLIQGLDVNHTVVTICQDAVPGTTYHLEFLAYSGTQGEILAEFNLSLGRHNDAIERIFFNLRAAYETALLLDAESTQYSDIFRYVTKTLNLLDLRVPFSPEFFRSIDDANAYIEKDFYEDYCGHSDEIAICVGHTHIDVAWLWRLAQTEEKAERSFATVLNMMDEYPEYVFMSSQPQLYKYIKQNNPEMYERIKARIAEGRWETEGAMWVEADCNLASGEALVRQVIHGKQFFKEEFGKDNRLLWLPDVFGYSAALPQILKKSGVDYFITSKISWNEYNHMPYDTFDWEGIDGTSVLTQFINTKENQADHAGFFSTYNGKIIPFQLAGGWKQYQQKNINNEMIVPFGFGDGGGGATRSDLEMAKRLKHGLPGVPSVKMGTSRDYMERLEARVKDEFRLPRWVGELYLEYHRGTYTSMARNKKYNRKSELLLQNAEWANVLSSQTTGSEYPEETLYNNWETVLLNQFHDILPGSSIKEVYDDSLEQYQQVEKEVTSVYEEAVKAIAGQVEASEDSLVVFNPTSYSRKGVVCVDGKKVIVEDVPSMGYKTVPCAGLCPASTVTVGDKTLSNEYFTLTFDGDYNITSILDKRENREVLSGTGNAIQAFEDLPHNYDNWDINIYYQEKMWAVNEVSAVETVDLGAAKGFRITRPFLSSTIEQTILLYDGIDRIDFETYIDWKESHILLKSAFPVQVHANRASYDIQYGNVERPTHWNTSWDKAKFEVCAHKWADLSEDGYGVSLINDCKYGYDIKDGVMRLTLLRAGTEPNPVADKEEHRFVYSLYPHAGGWREANTPKMAYDLNVPLVTAERKAGSGNLPAQMSMVSLDKENAIIEVVKQAYDGKGIIVRIYDCYNRTEKVTLTAFKELKEILECNLLEENLSPVKADGNQFTFELTPYEIKTYRLVF